jgi:hypothetical protein
MLEGYFLAMAWLAGVGALISSTEFLFNWRQFREDGIFSWTVVEAGRQARNPAVSRWLGAFLGYPSVLAILSIHVAGALLLVISAARGTLSLPLLLIVSAAHMVINYRNQPGLEGSDQMMAIVIFAMLFYSAAPESRLVAVSCLWFVALQACLSYFAAGVAKLASPVWRSGQALLDVLNTATYGLEPISRLLHRKPFLSKVLCWNVILFQSLFPLALVLGEPAGFVFLAWGALFHVVGALVMRLNRFVWAFLASYPAILFGMRQIDRFW